MKNLITSIAICLVTAILLSACSTSGAFTKRRYTRGYYISHQHTKHNPPAHPAAEKAGPQPVAEAPARNTESVTAPQIAYATQTTQKSGKIARVLSVIKQKTAANRYAKKSVSAEPVQLSLRESYRSSHATLSAAKPMASDQDALSLFWIVILVILILWLLGVLTGGWGLGGLINILLVIALILLILWLLRIL